MPEECPDCGGPTRLARAARRTTGLPVRLRVHGNTDAVDGQRKLNVTTTVCEDCGRIRFRAAVEDPRTADAPEVDAEAAAGDHDHDHGEAVDPEAAGSEVEDVGDPEDVEVDETVCPVCGGGTATVSPVAGGFDVRLVETGGARGGPRKRLPIMGLACGDCGAVAFYGRGSGGEDGADDEVTCPSCSSGMRLTTISGFHVLVDDGLEDGRTRVEPVAWACRDCGLSLFYDSKGGEEKGEG